VIGSRVHVREQTCNIQCFLYHITHFAICLQSLEEEGVFVLSAEHDRCRDADSGSDPELPSVRWPTGHRDKTLSISC
jgi:hypothetical protein